MGLIELTQNEYVVSLLILLGFVVLAIASYFILKFLAKTLAKKSKRHLDDEILAIIEKPVYIFIVLLGVYLTLRNLSILFNYLKWIEGGFYIITVFIISFALARVFSVLICHWIKIKGKHKKTPQLFGKVIAFVIYILALLIILGHFNVEISPLLATLGIAGLAVALALQKPLSDFFSGLHLLSDKPIKSGDYVEIEPGLEGYVEDIGWRSTKIRTWTNNLIIIPNSKLSDSVIYNTQMPDAEMSFLVGCGVAYDSDLKKVEEITLDVAKKIQKTVKGAVKDFKPFMRYKEFGDSNINFYVVLRVEERIKKFIVRHKFIKQLKDRYDKENIEISWPVIKTYLMDKKEDSKQ